MEFKLLDVTQNEIPELPEELRHVVMGMTMQRGKIYVGLDIEDGVEVVRSMLGIYPSYVPTAVEVGLFYTFGDDVVVTRELFDFAMKDNDATVIRCQMSDDATRQMITSLGFVQETTIYATDMQLDNIPYVFTSVAGKAFNYLTPEQIESIRTLIRVGGAEEASFTNNPSTPSDEDIDAMLKTAQESMVDLYVHLDGEEPVALLAVEPMMQRASVTCCVVHPNYRRKGIGRALLGQAIKDYVRDEDDLLIATVMECTPHLKAFVESAKMAVCGTVHTLQLVEEKEEA